MSRIMLPPAAPIDEQGGVSSHDQKEDLRRQVEQLELFCSANGWQYKIIEDLGSGMNYNKKGLKSLIKALCNQEIGRLVVTHKDRLLRFGSELVFSICSHVGCEVVIINASEDSSYEEDLTRDVSRTGVRREKLGAPKSYTSITSSLGARAEATLRII